MVDGYGPRRKILGRYNCLKAALDHALSLGVALLDNDPALGHVMRVNLPEGLTP